MSDLISRQDVIQILSQRAEILRGEYGDLGGACSGALKIIKSLPSAEPERKKGEWISHENYDECSKCHCFTSVGFNYCPHCGADMTNKSGYMDIEEEHYG